MTSLYSGLAIGAVYALVAMGYNVVFLASGVFNFAQAQYVTLGGFVGAVAAGAHGAPMWVVVPAGAVLGGLAGALQERLTIRPIRGGDGGGHNELITTIGVAVLIEGLVLVFFGPDPLSVPFPGGAQPITLLGGTVLPVEIALVVVAVLVAAALALFLRRTSWGLAALACAEDRDAARLRGIDVRTVAVGAFALAGALGFAVGPLVASKTLAVFSLGTAVALKSFVALALGGFGSQAGALFGGFAIGLVEAATVRWLGTEFGLLAVFVLLLGVLLVRPNGMFGNAAGRPA
ncbi:branched-chain amino acid ABC transporter permease [Pseudonocardia xishanensis]